MVAISHKPLLSVIVPMYNTEKFLPKCLNSIVEQTYKNLEIIIVNDASPQDAKSIVASYSSKDSRIRYLEHEQNKGLFHARISGVEQASGEYIAFVDSDDSISIDYFRVLIDKAVENNADIVEGRIIREREDGYRFVQNFNNMLFDELNGEEVPREFFAQEGLFYHWHVIWNKIYSKKLWDWCMPYFKKQMNHLVMTEDLVFSSLLFCNARKYCSVKYDGYFYSIRAEAATGTETNVEKFFKNFQDMGLAFKFVGEYLTSAGLHERYGNHLRSWKERYFRLWAARIQSESLSPAKRNQAIRVLQESLDIHHVDSVQPEDHYHGLVNTPWERKYEDLKRKISDPSIRYVSFDVFDTLVLRPFIQPSDLFKLLDEYFHQLFPNSEMVDFANVRHQAELRRRNLVTREHPSWQDINIHEVYEQLMLDYSIPENMATILKNKEIELELRFTSQRKSVFELYKMALELGKKVIFVSDMYLTKEIVHQIVEKSGYDYYDQLFVSSETRVLKHTGAMYKYVVNELKVDPSQILHLGDNWNSDKIKAEECGWNSFFIPKTTDLLFNRLGDKESGGSTGYFGGVRSNLWREMELNEYLGTSSMLGIVANKIFDHPFPSFNSDSDFNIDPYFIGYYALGMQVFSLSKWMLDNSIEKDYGTIHFMARDGYLPFKVYNVMASYFDKAARANYFYASRKSLLPYCLLSYNKYGLTSLISVYAHSPKSVLQLFGCVIKDDPDLDVIKKQGFKVDKKFDSQHEFIRFVDLLTEQFVDGNKLNKYIETMRNYFNSMIGENDATFDLGYSARLQTIMVGLLGRRCDAYFVHTNKELPWLYARRHNFELKTFYNLKPVVSGILREHLYAELGPSCVGYEMNGSEVKPLFEQYSSNYINEYMIKTLQQACIDFSRDMMDAFADVLSMMTFNNEVSSIPLEMYIHASKPIDRSILTHSYSDDTVHAANARNSILNWWNVETEKVINQHAPVYHYVPPYHANRFSKFIYLFLFDRKQLKIKLRTRLITRPRLLRFMLMSYRLLRSMKVLVSR